MDELAVNIHAGRDFPAYATMQVPSSIAGRYEKQDIYKRCLKGLFIQTLCRYQL
jgi:hypothetical protein